MLKALKAELKKKGHRADRHRRAQAQPGCGAVLQEAGVQGAGRGEAGGGVVGRV
jgi:hypothetical protein